MDLGGFLSLHVIIGALALMGALTSVVGGKKAVGLATGFIWLAFIVTIIGGALHQLIGLKLVLSLLIGFISAIVHHFSIRYMQGDILYRRYFVYLSLLTAALYGMVLTDSVWVLAGAWFCANLLLVELMRHKSGWSASNKAAILAGINLGLSTIALLIGITFLVINTSSHSIQTITTMAFSLNPFQLFIALACITCAALMQSAQWPCHRWLLSSLNAPTPVSAFMHAGLINAGGILLAIFSPLYQAQPGWLVFIFVIGAITALIASYWKLLQNNIKGLLATSTMAQMGFMMMQCGLGLYSAAVVHLCWHGLFKGYLFLSSPSALNHKGLSIDNQPLKAQHLPYVIVASILGTLSFVMGSQIGYFKADTSVILLGFVFLASAQVAVVFLSKEVTLNVLLATFFITAGFGYVYGLSVFSLKHLLAETLRDTPYRLNLFHLIMLGIFVVIWAIKVFNWSISKRISQALYVWGLNASRPQVNTLTMNRQNYVIGG